MQHAVVGRAAENLIKRNKNFLSEVVVADDKHARLSESDFSIN